MGGLITFITMWTLAYDTAYVFGARARSDDPQVPTALPGSRCSAHQRRHRGAAGSPVPGTIGLAAAAANGESQRGTQVNLAVSGDGSGSVDDGEVDARSSPGATAGDEVMADAEAAAGMSDF
eukprot:TRINITY_DN10570_c0_g1_i1.p1 TRINITY_DN10570_c0_g1~~TRINITY_DN10570_c0_g1_i1.p1  ORF type:complete len:122 (+),score=17.49 TRINITY_DN10570_c0_g1_i1:194-559(+)